MVPEMTVKDLIRILSGFSEDVQNSPIRVEGRKDIANVVIHRQTFHSLDESMDRLESIVVYLDLYT